MLVRTTGFGPLLRIFSTAGCLALINWVTVIGLGLASHGAGVVIDALAGAPISGAVQSTPPTVFDPAGATIHIEDVDRFYKVYDAAGGHPTADQVQHDYLDPGSEGLHQFAKMRKISRRRRLPKPWLSVRRSIRAPSGAWTSCRPCASASRSRSIHWGVSILRRNFFR